MNLNKYTKAELISKIKGLKNNPDTNNKLLSYIYLFKSFIVKLTFLTLIFKFFKKFSVLRRLYLIFNGALMAIFGISMLDIYGLSIFSAFFTEITYITTNIINYLTNTHFYSLISGFFGYKVSTPTKIEPLRTINQSPTRIQTENPRINKING